MLVGNVVIIGVIGVIIPRLNLVIIAVSSMCISPRHIQVKRATISDGCLVRVAVPCGKCYQCRKKKQNDYYLRAYYQTLHCFKTERGFILFDTLTYADEWLPHLHDFIGDPDFWVKHSDLDFSCFNKRHIQLFFKQLRITLERAGYDVVGKLKYFLSSEYGTDERFTHRPHYHIMFYVDFLIDPIVLSYYIGKCWKYGRTDGTTYKGSRYVLEHCTFGKLYNTNFTEALTSCEYVSKYVTKDSSFETSLEFRRAKLSGYFDMDDVVKVVNPFLRISSGFGESILDEASLDDIIKNDGVTIVDKKNVRKFFSLPQYYRRKLFMDTIRYADDDGNKKVTYSLNDVGTVYFIRRTQMLINSLASSYQDFLHTFRIFTIKNGSSFVKELLRNMVEQSSHPLFFHRLARFQMLVLGRLWFSGIKEEICTLSMSLIEKVTQSNWFERSIIVKTDADLNRYVGELIDGETLAHQLGEDVPLFNKNCYTLLRFLIGEGNYDYITPEFARFNSFLKSYEVANYFLYVNADQNDKRKQRSKRHYKSIYSLLNI